MKTLAQFKRDAATGHMGLELVERYGKKVETHEICPIIKIHSRGVELKRVKGNSSLDIPYASLIEYDGDTLKVFDMGSRLPNDLEQSILDSWKKIENTPAFVERARVDAISDGSSTYYQQKRFFDNSPCPYLFTDKPNLKYKAYEGLVYDSKIKGKCILKYRIHKI